MYATLLSSSSTDSGINLSHRVAVECGTQYLRKSFGFRGDTAAVSRDILVLSFVIEDDRLFGESQYLKLVPYLKLPRAELQSVDKSRGAIQKEYSRPYFDGGLEDNELLERQPRH